MRTRTILCGAFAGMLTATGMAAESYASAEAISADSATVGCEPVETAILNNPRLTQLLKEASLSPGVQQVARMAEIQLDEAVIQSYVTNSATRFNLQPEDLFHLHEHGVPSSVITAMIERGAELRAKAPPEPPSPPPPPAPTYYQPARVSTVNYIASPAIYSPAMYRPSQASTVTVIGSSYPRGQFRSAGYYYPYPRIHSRTYGGTYLAYSGRSSYSGRSCFPQSRYHGKSYRHQSSRGYRCRY